MKSFAHSVGPWSLPSSSEVGCGYSGNDAGVFANGKIISVYNFLAERKIPFSFSLLIAMNCNQRQVNVKLL